MRIAFLGTRGVPARYSGFETAVEKIGERMVSLGHEVTVYCRQPQFRDLHSHRGMSLRHLPAIRQKHLETLSHTALSAMQSRTHDVLICMGVGNAPVVRWLEATGSTVLFNVDGADWQRAKWGVLASRYLRFCEGLAARSASTLIADARVVQSHYREMFGRDSTFIPYGAEPPADTGVEILEELGIGMRPYILFVGRLVPENGAHDVISAASRADLPGAATVIVGDAPYSEAYIDELRQKASLNTIFAGYQFGIQYQQITSHPWVFVLAASVGGTHPVLLEQMAAGNCILARDTASNREVLGPCGLYWQTVDELAEHLKDVWKHPEKRTEYAESGAERARHLYSWDAVTAAYIDACLTANGTMREGMPRSYRQILWK